MLGEFGYHRSLLRGAAPDDVGGPEDVGGQLGRVVCGGGGADAPKLARVKLDQALTVTDAHQLATQASTCCPAGQRGDFATRNVPEQRLKTVNVVTYSVFTFYSLQRVSDPAMCNGTNLWLATKQRLLGLFGQHSLSRRPTRRCTRHWCACCAALYVRPKCVVQRCSTQWRLSCWSVGSPRPSSRRLYTGEVCRSE